MRKHLFPFVNQELSFEGTVRKFSFRYQREEKPISKYHRKQLYPTVLITDINTINNIYIDHFWVIIPIDESVIMKMKTGNRIAFKSIVEKYIKKDKFVDVGINRFRKLKTIGIDERFKNKDRIDFINWWFDERWKHNITEVCYKYDTVVLKCRDKKFYKNPRIKRNKKQKMFTKEYNL